VGPDDNQEADKLEAKFRAVSDTGDVGGAFDFL
jgi:hypothetical protein